MFEILFLLLFVFLPLAGLVTGIVFWTTSARGSDTAEMVCGKCGYSVRGLTQLNCPECGADLREVGIGRGVKTGRRRLGIALTLASAGVFLLFCVLSGFWFMGVSTQQSVRVHSTTRISPAPSPATPPAGPSTPSTTP